VIGETVVVERPVETGRDAHNEPIVEWVSESVADVLVAPGPRADISDAMRPVGTVVEWNLHFPKSWSGSLRGARISVRGGVPCGVVGDPQPFTLENTPTRWWLPVEVSRADG
jgi:hypothetical protein